MDGEPRPLVVNWDGTLVDSRATANSAFAQAFSAAGLPPPGPAAVRRVVSCRWPKQPRLYCRGTPKKPPNVWWRKIGGRTRRWWQSNSRRRRWSPTPTRFSAGSPGRSGGWAWPPARRDAALPPTWCATG